MIADLKPYSEYRESGLPWLRQVPGHWEVRRLRHACEMRVSNVDKHTKIGEIPVRLCNYVDVYKNERITQSTRFMAATATEDERLRFRMRLGDVLITKDSEQWNDIGVPALVEHEASDLVCGYHLAILRPRFGLRGPFLHRALESHFIAAQFHVEANGVTRFGLSHGAILGVAIPLPPPDEQAAIARFLDWANGRLERAIRAKRKVIALLNEQKQAIIHRAVTRGLDPNVPLKDSGVPWLGEIPKHWEVRKIRAFASRVTKGTTPTTLGKQFVDSGVRFVKVESISSNRSILENKCAFIDDATDKLLSRSRLRANDVVVSIAGAIGRPAVIEPSLLPANTNQAVGIVSLLAHLCRPEWLSYILASPMCLRAMTDASVQSAQANLSLANLGRTVIPLPPLHEQESILMSLASETAVLSRAISRLEREITLLREYRTRLVADVVTGKLDVRAAAASLPAEAPLDMESDSELETDEAEGAADEEAP